MRWLIAGGGTGGHFFPALEIAKSLAQKGDEVLFVGVKRGIEARLAPKNGFPIRFVPFEGIRGKGIAALVKGLLRLPLSVALCIKSIRDISPDGAIITGGYTSFPLAVACVIAGVPFFVHEQNSVPGWSNLAVSPFARRVWASFEESLKFFKKCRVKLTGNIVRSEILSGQFPLRPHPFTLLVVGGSRGAKSINKAMMEASFQLASLHIKLIHQTGEEDKEKAEDTYKRAKVKAEVKAFIEDMPSAYREASFVLCRAGATTLFELSSVGRGAILVPYPFAAGDHQKLNAQVLERRKAALVIDNRDCTGENLIRKLLPIFFNRRLCVAMGRRMKRALKPCSGEILAEEVRRELSLP